MFWLIAKFTAACLVARTCAAALQPSAAAHLAGYFDGSGSLAVQSRGLGLKLILQRASDCGAPLVLTEFANSFGGGSLKPVSALASDGKRQVWRLMYTAVAPQRAVLAEIFPYFQVNPEQGRVALEFQG